MEIQNKKVLVLGGTGLIASHVIDGLIREGCGPITVFANKSKKDDDAIASIKARYKAHAIESIQRNLMLDPYISKKKPHLRTSFFLKIIKGEAADIIIDGINTATIFSQQEIDWLTRYYLIIFYALKGLRETSGHKHPQIYLKLGTTGLGGMGLNLPYTHEQYTSEFMMRKTALSGAQTALLLLMARSPNLPIIKEIKPAAAVFRNRVGYDERKKMVFIDGGESGPYSMEEFSLLTSLGQMGFITADEVAEKIILKIRGDPTGHDVVSSLNRALIKPSYRAGVIREDLLAQARNLTAEKDIPSIAYGYLGPPIISKQLFEVALIIKSNQKEELLRASGRKLLNNILAYLDDTESVLTEISALGLALQLPQNVRCPVKAKPFKPGEGNDIWIDLTSKNIKAWQKVIQIYIREHPTISDRALSAGEIVGLYFKLQDRRRLEEKD
jgi:nucleoside-diphosphate-sugar epimerase